MGRAPRSSVGHQLRPQLDDAITVLEASYRRNPDDGIRRALGRMEHCRRLSEHRNRLLNMARDLEHEIERELDLLVTDLHASDVLSELLEEPDELPSRPTLGSKPSMGATAASADRGETELHAYGLGTFRVMFGDSFVESWESRRGESILKLLLTRQGGPIHRDELMASLWPEASFDKARNRLNVAIHGLRRSLVTQHSEPVIVHDNGSYRLSPQIGLWFDAAEFEGRVERGRRHERRGDADAAMSEYGKAAALYSGDLFPDDRDSEWAAGARRRLRLHYLEILDALGTRALELGDLDVCVQWSLALLDLEPWHEGAHARLMRCHARRGQPHLAIRQFVDYARVLRSELGAMPTRRTIELYEQIKQGVLLA